MPTDPTPMQSQHDGTPLEPDTPVKAARRVAFDYPSIANLQKLEEAVMAAERQQATAQQVALKAELSRIKELTKARVTEYPKHNGTWYCAEGCTHAHQGYHVEACQFVKNSTAEAEVASLTKQLVESKQETQNVGKELMDALNEPMYSGSRKDWIWRAQHSEMLLEDARTEIAELRAERK